MIFKRAKSDKHIEMHWGGDAATIHTSVNLKQVFKCWINCCSWQNTATPWIHRGKVRIIFQSSHMILSYGIRIYTIIHILKKGIQNLSQEDERTVLQLLFEGANFYKTFKEKHRYRWTPTSVEPGTAPHPSLPGPAFPNSRMEL